MPDNRQIVGLYIQKCDFIEIDDKGMLIMNRGLHKGVILLFSKQIIKKFQKIYNSCRFIKVLVTQSVYQVKLTTTCKVNIRRYMIVERVSRASILFYLSATLNQIKM